MSDAFTIIASFIGIVVIFALSYLAGNVLDLKDPKYTLIIYAFLTLFCYFIGAVGEVEVLVAIAMVTLLFIALRKREYD